MFSNVGGSLHEIKELIMQLISGGESCSAVFGSSTSDFLDPEAPFFLVVGLHTVQKDQL